MWASLHKVYVNLKVIQNTSAGRFVEQPLYLVILACSIITCNIYYDTELRVQISNYDRSILDCRQN